MVHLDILIVEFFTWLFYHKIYLKEIANLSPSVHEAHAVYQHVYRVNPLWSICLIKSNGIICSKILKTSSGSKTGISRHLQNEHGIKAEKNIQPQNSIKHYTHEKIAFEPCFERDICYLVAVDLITPNTIIKSNTLRELLENRWNVKMPSSANTIWKIVYEYADEMKKSLINSFKDSGKMHSLTADEWTCRSGNRYLNVNCHIKNEQFCLGLARINKSANAEFLGELINSKLEEFQLKAMSITTDGAAVMTSMCTKINLLQQKCQLHGVNLAIKDIFYKPINQKMPALEIVSNDTPEKLKQFDFNDVEEIELQEALLPLIKKVRAVMKQFKYGKQKDELAEIQKTEIQKTLETVLDVPTRWNSLLPMLQRFVLLFDCFRLHAALNKYDFQCDQQDSTDAQEIINILAPIEIFIKEVGKNDSNLIVADVEMLKCLNKIGYGSKLKDKIRQALISRFSDRRTFFSDILWDINDVASHCPHENIFYEKPDESSLKQTEALFSNNEKRIEMINLSDYARNPKARKISAIDFDLINDNLLIIKPSSIRPEQVFSVCSRIKTPIRGRMSEKSLSNILFLNLNLKK